MIYINFVEVHSLMLHYKFQIIGLPVLQKKFFLKFFAIYSHGGNLGHVTMNIQFQSHYLTMLHIKFGFNWLSSFREEAV